MKQININKLPMNMVLSFGAAAARALHKEADLDIKYITEALLRAKVEDARQKNTIYQNAKALLGGVQDNLDDACKKAFTFARLVRDHFKPNFGSQYSQLWDKVGFYNRTLEIPRSAPRVLGLVTSMALFLQTFPELAVPGFVTFEIAAATADVLGTAYSDVASAKSDLRQKKKVRDEAMADLRRTLVLLRRELSMVLTNDDPRWLEFGFNVPSDVSTPTAPEGMAVTSSVAGEAELSWGKPENTDRFHLYQQTMGVDPEPVRVATLTETATKRTGLTPGAQVRFYVTAVNAAGESVPSGTVEIVVPPSGGDVGNSPASAVGGG